MKIKIYPRRNQRTCTVVLQDVRLFETTKVSQTPQLRWRFLVDFGDNAFEHDIWSKTQVTAEATIASFIIAATNNFYPESTGEFSLEQFVGTAVKAVWGVRKTQKSEKETILRFLPAETAKPEAAEPTQPKKQPEVEQVNLDDIESIRYAVQESDKQYYFKLMEVPVQFSDNEKLKKILTEKGVKWNMEGRKLIVQMHSGGMEMMRDELKDVFRFLKRKPWEV